MTPTTVTLPGGRVATLVPADEAGEFALSCAEGIIAVMRENGQLTMRQCDAAESLSRLYGLGGGARPWRGPGGATGREEDAVAAARAEFARLLARAPRDTQGALTVLCQGEWIVSYNPLAHWRRGLDAVADALRLGS